MSDNGSEANTVFCGGKTKRAVLNCGTSFSSTYRIPFVAGTETKKDLLRKRLKGYQNVLIPEHKGGAARISVRKRLDGKIEKIISELNFKEYQKFDRHNVPKTDDKLDNYIREQLLRKDYKQFGKQISK